MDGKGYYRNLERLMELGRRLHSQTIFESLTRLVVRTRHFGKNLSFGEKTPGETGLRKNLRQLTPEK